MGETDTTGKPRLKQFGPQVDIIKENERSRRMYIIKSGKVRVYKSYFGRKVTIAVLGAGEVFGELSFFDAEPRSASVETLTDVEAIVIDGDESLKQIEHLPPWVLTIFKSVFYRFREMDQKLMIFQNMYEFQKKSFSTDLVAKTIYIELLRFNKVMMMEYDQKSKLGAVNFEELYKEMDETLGKKDVSLRGYFKSLAEHNLIKIQNPEQLKGPVIPDLDAIKNMNSYLQYELDHNRYLLLGHASLALIRGIIGYLDELKKKDDASKIDAKNEPIKITDIPVKKMPFYDEAIAELKRYKFLDPTTGAISISLENINYHYIYQSILKSFDRTIMQVD